MAHQPIPVAATLAIRVPVNAPGTLVEGAVRVVERIDGVESVEAPDIRGLRPGMNDCTVVLRAEVAIAVDEDRAVIERRLGEAVGVVRVDEVRRIDAGVDPPRLVVE